MRLLRFAATLALAIGLAAGTHAQTPREVATSPAVRALRVEMETALGDVLARPVFKSLRSDAGWGPANRVWLRTFTRFRDAYLDFALPALRGLDAPLEAALRKQMTRAQLGVLASLLHDPAYNGAVTELALLGLDSFTLVRVAGVSRFPELYGEGEKLGVHTTFAGLGALQQRRGLDDAKVEAALKVAQRPELRELQTLLSAVLSDALKGAMDDRRAQAFLAAWRNEVKED